MKDLMNIVSVLKIDLSWLPSVACMLQDFTFHDHLLFYALVCSISSVLFDMITLQAPLGVFVVLGLPSLAAHAMRVNEDLKNDCISTFSRSMVQKK